MEVFLCRTVAEQGTKPRPQMRGLSAGYGAAATSVVPSHSVRTSYARHPTVAVTRAPTGQPDLRATQSRLVVIAQAACTSIQLLCIASHRWATPVTFRRAAPSSRSGAMGRARDAPPRWPLLLALCAAARLPRPAEARAPCVTEPETDATLVRATPGAPPGAAANAPAHPAADVGYIRMRAALKVRLRRKPYAKATLNQWPLP